MRSRKNLADDASPGAVRALKCQMLERVYGLLAAPGDLPHEMLVGLHLSAIALEEEVVVEMPVDITTLRKLRPRSDGPR
jgi:hypothetical protein